MNIGDRVTTQHGGGTIDNFEKCNHAGPGRPPHIAGTGRYGVKLDNNPFVGLKDGIAYYWPNELKPESTVRHGTCHYVSEAKARMMYGSSYASKIAEGAVCIGPPTYDPTKGESLGVYQDEGRYYVNRPI